MTQDQFKNNPLEEENPGAAQAPEDVAGRHCCRGY